MKKKSGLKDYIWRCKGTKVYVGCSLSQKFCNVWNVGEKGLKCKMEYLIFLISLHTNLSALLFGLFSSILIFFFFEFCFPSLFLSSHLWKPDTGLVRKAAITSYGSCLRGSASSRLQGWQCQEIQYQEQRDNQPNKGMHLMSWANDSSEIQSESMERIQRSQAAVAHLCTHFTPCKGWTRSKSWWIHQSDEAVCV